MKITRVYAALLVTAFSAVLAAGCKPTDDTPVSMAVTTTVSRSVQQIKQTFANGLTIDANVTISKGMDTQAVKVIKAEPIQFNAKTVQETFLKGKTVKEHKQLNPGATRGGNKTPEEQYTTVDGSQLLVDTALGQIFLSTPLSQAISYAYFDQEGGSYYNRDAYQKQDLSFMPRAEAVAQVQAILKKIGIPEIENVDVVALDPQTLQKEELDPKKVDIKPETAPNKKGTWTEDDACYVMYFHQEMGGFRLDQNVDAAVPGKPSIVVYYGKSGIVYFSGAAYQQTKDPVETKPVVSAEQAMQAFSRQYSAIPTSSGMEIKASEICLEPYFQSAGATTDACQISPVWRISASMKTADTQGDGDFSIYVDAITGKLLT